MITFLVGCLFGAVIGSFLNVCVHRLPRNLSVVSPGSRCCACGGAIAWFDNLPVLSWLLLRGRCRACGTRFSVRYAMVELATGLAMGGIVHLCLEHGLAAPWLLALGVPPPLASGLAAAALVALACLLIVASLIDLDHTIIPDEITLPFQAIAPLLALATPLPLALGGVPTGWFERDSLGGATPDAAAALAPVGGLAGGAIVALLLSLPVARMIYRTLGQERERWRDDDHRCLAINTGFFAAVSAVHLVAWAVLAWLARPDTAAHHAAIHLGWSLLGAQTGWWSLYGVGLLGSLAFRRNAMGFGDVKFLAPLGALLGPLGVVYAFAAAALVATVVGVPRLLLRRSGSQIPFGPFLAVGAVVAVLGGAQATAWLAACLGR